MKWRWAWLLPAGLTLAAPARAQSNYRIAPIGGRSQMLGGTGMVYGRDATAGFLNPATAVLVDDQRLSFSVNFYSIAFVNASRWYLPGPIDRQRFGSLEIQEPKMFDLEFNALPSSLCFFFNAPDIKALVREPKKDHRQDARVGLCFATIQSDSWNFAAEGFSEARSPSVTRQAQTLAQSFTRFAGGPTYAMHVTDNLAIGASVHASLATHRSLLAASATTYGSSATAINSMFYSGSRGDAFQLEAIVGATLRLGDQTLGISVKSPSLHVYGVGGANRQSYFDGAGSATSLVSAQGSFAAQAPLRLGFGTGITKSWGMFELDTLVQLPTASAFEVELEGNQIATQEGAVVEDRPAVLNLSQRARGVVNLAAGLELNLTPRVSLLTGLATDMSAVPSGGLKGSLVNYFPAKTNRIAGSIGVSSHGDGGELLLGAEFSAGWGQRLAVNSYQLPPEVGVTGHTTYQLMLIIAGSTSLRTIKRAVEDVKEVLTEPKKKKAAPTPAPYNPRDHED